MAKRKRAPGAGATEGWRELAETVPVTLAAVVLGTTVLLGTVDSAHRELATYYARTLRALREGAANANDDGKFDDNGPSPSAALQGALRDLAALDALCGGAGYAYRLYATRSDDRVVLAPLYQSWLGHSRDAIFQAGDARRKLRSAASEARAAEAAIRLFRSVPIGSPDRTAWTTAALPLALHATISAAVAWRALRRMRGAVRLLWRSAFYDAPEILNRAS